MKTIPSVIRFAEELGQLMNKYQIDEMSTTGGSITFDRDLDELTFNGMTIRGDIDNDELQSYLKTNGADFE